MTTPAIDVVAARKEYGKVVAVHDVNFQVKPGEFIGLVGPNGAGKSTTIKMLSGQLLPTSGSLRLCGVDVSAEPDRARSLLGYVPEFPTLYDYLTAREMVSFVARIRGVTDPGAVDDALDMAGLGGDADRLIHEYSQGMHRKTALACAVVAKPPVLILDEALNGLDPPSAARVVRRLHRARDEGAAVLLSTHVLDVLEKVADRIIMIVGGEVVADVGPDQLDEVHARFDAIGPGR
jgi:ABC-2 type transport system ATP-binding protein